MRNFLISTVGTSLFSNINGKYRDDSGVSPEVHRRLQQFLTENNIGQLSRELKNIPKSARICGAEINSIDEAINHRKVVLEHIIFLVSDTDDGRRMGQLLEAVCSSISGLKTVEFHTIIDLKDNDPKKFRTHGLRNLVRTLGRFVQQHGADTIVIDATGGYKAQIAIAVVFGQALGIPILYRHERFSEIIEFPPMPIAFDYDVLGENSDILACFETGEAMTLSDLNTLDERLRVLLDEIEEDGEILFALGPIGLIFLESFRLRYPRSRQLTPVLPQERKSPTFADDHHRSKEFVAFVQRVYEETLWVKTIHTLPAHKQRSIRGIGFYVYENDKLIGTYRDKERGYRFEIMTNANGIDQFTWAADQLNQLYQSNKMS
jgi:putative CRISPR-associated protein (TIGR02619 family)